MRTPTPYPHINKMVIRLCRVHVDWSSKLGSGVDVKSLLPGLIYMGGHDIKTIHDKKSKSDARPHVHFLIRGDSEKSLKSVVRAFCVTMGIVESGGQLSNRHYAITGKEFDGNHESMIAYIFCRYSCCIYADEEYQSMIDANYDRLRVQMAQDVDSDSDDDVPRASRWSMYAAVKQLYYKVVNEHRECLTNLPALQYHLEKEYSRAHALEHGVSNWHTFHGYVQTLFKANMPEEYWTAYRAVVEAQQPAWWRGIVTQLNRPRHEFESVMSEVPPPST